MREMLASFRTELRLETREWALWVLFGLWQVAVVFTLVTNAELPPGMRAWQIVSGFLPVLGTAAVLFFTYVVSREDSRGLSDLVDALPHRAQGAILGKLLAAMTLWTVFGLELLLVVVAVQVRSGLPLAGAALPALFLGAAYLSVLAAAAGIGSLAAAWLGSSRLTYVAAVAGWLGLVALGPSLVAHLSYSTRWVMALSPSAIEESWSEVWGAFPRGGLAWFQNLWGLGLGLALMGLAGAVYRRRRDRDFRPLASALVGLAGVILAAGGVAGYVGTYGSIAKASAAPVEYYSGPVEEDEASWLDVTAYDLTVTLGPGHRLRVEGTMSVTNSGTRPQAALPLTLNPALVIESLQAERGPGQAGTTVPALARKGHLLTLILDRTLEPGESASLAFTYGGEVWDWTRNLSTGSQPNLVAGVDEGGVWLPAGCAWYPAPGHQALGCLVYSGPPETESPAEVGYSPLRFTPAGYRVAVRGCPGLAFGTSLGIMVGGPGGDGPARVASGRTTSTAGLLLFGAPGLTGAQGAGGPVITAPGLVGAGLEASAEVGRVRDLLNEILPGPDHPSVTVAGLPLRSSDSMFPSQGDGLVLSEWGVAYAGQWRETGGKAAYHPLILAGELGGQDLLSTWLGPEPDFFSHSDSGARDVGRAARAFLWALIAGELGTPDDYSAGLTQARLRLSWQGEAGLTSVLDALDELYRAKGLAGVRQAFSLMWDRLLAGTLSADEALEAVDEARRSGGQTPPIGGP